MHTTEQLSAALSGRYVVERRIGEGGMATVYLARDIRHNRRVALKVLKPDLGAIVGEERFLTEIQLTANLQHPNLLPLFDSGAADGLLFYVMPFVEGESLRVRLEREKQLPVDEAVRLATAIGGALDYAHRHGVIHRDLKPENILLNEDQPLIADFGIALAVSKAGGNRITQTGLSLGTPQYMSPEQATGDRVIDGRTDIYSLGALTYEMLTGEPPHTGNTSQAVIARVLTEKPRSIRVSRPNVSEDVEAAVERALEKLPADRWATAREFCDAIQGKLVTRATTARTARGPAALPSHLRRWRELAGWTVALVAALILIATRKDADDRPALPLAFELALPDSVEATTIGTASSIAISLDGSVVVFQGTPIGGVPALYARRLDELEAQRIRGADSARAPVISPDGSELGFAVVNSRNVTETIRRVPLRGGAPRTFLPAASTNGQVSWGDAGELVFARERALYRVSAAGGADTLIAAPDTARGRRGYGFPDVLPGGRAALITIWKGLPVLDSTFLGVVTLPEGTVTELGVRGTFPRYSGTGHVLYASSDGWVHAIPFDAGSLRTTGASFPVVEGVRVGSGGAAGFSVARNGTLAYLSGDADAEGRQLVAVDRTGVERLLSNKRINASFPRVSPDGRQVALTVAGIAGRGGSLPDVWRLDLGSDVLTRVTTDSASLRPVWLGNDRIAFLRTNDSIAYSVPLYARATRDTFARASSDIGQIEAGPTYSVLRLSRGVGVGLDVWVAHRDSLRTPRPLMTEAYAEQTIALSPDGQLLAYSTNRSGELEVYVRRMDGSEGEVQVSTSGGTEARWSRTGDRLIYRANGWFWEAEITRAPRLAVTRRDTIVADRTNYLRSTLVQQYDVLPNGDLVVLRRGEATQSAMRPVIMMNWHLKGPARP